MDALLGPALERAAALSVKPSSTYRIQFHAGFTFGDATQILLYLKALGVSHLYASPILKALPGSTHGYDVMDHCSLNPELGQEPDVSEFFQAVRDNGLSILLDTVPNHAGIATNDNTWWNELLKHGPEGKYGRAFDVDWTGSPRPDLHNRVLLPLLGKPYAAALEDGDLKLCHGDDDDSFFIAVGQRMFPLNEESASVIRGDPAGADAAIKRINASPDELDDLLSKQYFRLAYWKTAPDEINYRRFFDVNDLAALAMEREAIFAETHQLTLSLVANGTVSGLRIDHPDGLTDPLQYFQRLQQYFILACIDGKSAVDLDRKKPALLQRLSAMPLPHLYILGEKILALDERLDARWPVDGTTGYRFLNMINGLFVDPAGDEPFTDLYRDLTAARTDYAALVHEKKRLILDTSMASELTMLTEKLVRIAADCRLARDCSRRILQTTLAELIASFGVYRTYITAAGHDEEDIRRIDAAIADAASRNPQLERGVFDFIRGVLLKADKTPLELAFTTRFQQLTAPVMAKGVEDTTFYLYNRLLSLNEVGGDPSVFGQTPAAVHDYLLNRQRRYPLDMSSLSTHDTKRSEDVRARLNVLSEMPDQWRKAVRSWMQMNRADHAAGPNANEEYLIYQSMLGIWPLGIWPLGISPAEGEACRPTSDWIERINAYALKAMREGKETTTWTAPNEPHERSVKQFVERICDPHQSSQFLADFADFAAPIARLGLINSLAQAALKFTAPGVPDTYQGQELWDFSLVDPDNRRAVDYKLRQTAIESLHALVNAHRNDLTGVARDLMERINDGHAKLWLTQVLLEASNDHPDLFRGDYAPVAAAGARADHVFAFTRSAGGRHALIVVPRLVSAIGGFPGEWVDTTLRLPPESANVLFRNCLTGESLHAPQVQMILAHFPVAVFIST